MANEVATTGIHALTEAPQFKKRIEQVLGRRAPQFVASVLQTTLNSNGLSKANPRSVLGAAMIAATLDLPIDPNLGFAWIVPYSGQAQFQMGWKGYVQLALRTGKYGRMNAMPVNDEALGGWDDIGERQIIWAELDRDKPAVGYAFVFELVTGFRKLEYWSRERMQKHAKRFSQAYRSGKKDSPWFTDEEAMSLKTLVKLTLGKWGILSVEMQGALRDDQTSRRDIGADPEYIDANVVSAETVTDEVTGSKTDALAEKVGAGKPTRKPRTPKKKPVEPPEGAKQDPASNDTPEAPNTADGPQDAGTGDDPPPPDTDGQGALFNTDEAGSAERPPALAEGQAPADDTADADASDAEQRRLLAALWKEHRDDMEEYMTEQDPDTGKAEAGRIRATIFGRRDWQKTPVAELRAMVESLAANLRWRRKQAGHTREEATE